MSKENSYKRQAALNVFQQQNAVYPAKEAIAEMEQLSRGRSEEPAGKWGNLDEIGASTRLKSLGYAGGGGSAAVDTLASMITAKPAPVTSDLMSSEELQLMKEPIQVRQVGVWPFKRIIVPPNVYVVHTRLGKKDPVTIGLGCSFPFDPYRDAYLVVPAAMQTIGIVANSISSEKQGINVLAYVQWQIQDFSVAYKKLDFSDSRDPLGIVNAQLREQAEAAIKDKIATMTIDEVLTDKQPIIEELTARLKAVAEGRGDSSEGLGIKIVTVQLKEAYVSSYQLWEHLQAPFRHKQQKIARISHLEAQEEVRTKELDNRRLAETSEAETMMQIERIKQNTQTESLETRLSQEKARFTFEQESERQKIQLSEQTILSRKESERRLQVETARLEQDRKLATLKQAQEEEVERARLAHDAGVRQKELQVEQALKELTEETRLADSRLEAERKRIKRETQLNQEASELAIANHAQEAQLLLRQLQATVANTRIEQMSRLELEEATAQVRQKLGEREIELARLRQEVENMIDQNGLATRMIAKLPELAAQMPDVHELKVLQTGSGDYDSLSLFLGRVKAIAESIGVQGVQGVKKDSKE